MTRFWIGLNRIGIGLSRNESNCARIDFLRIWLIGSGLSICEGNFDSGLAVRFVRQHADLMGFPLSRMCYDREASEMWKMEL